MFTLKQYSSTDDFKFYDVSNRSLLESMLICLREKFTKILKTLPKIRSNVNQLLFAIYCNQVVVLMEIYLFREFKT